VNSYEHIKLN
jgi:hypothetical protein